METELVWVDKKFALKYKQISKEAERVKAFEEYIETVKERSREEFKANLNDLEEDVAIYTGLMLKVRQAFEKAKKEELDASYQLWEKFEDEIPSVEKKVNKFVDLLKPIIEKLEEINSLADSLDNYGLKKLTENINAVSSMQGKSKEMIEFLIKNFGGEK